MAVGLRGAVGVGGSRGVGEDARVKVGVAGRVGVSFGVGKDVAGFGSGGGVVFNLAAEEDAVGAGRLFCLTGVLVTVGANVAVPLDAKFAAEDVAQPTSRARSNGNRRKR